MTDSLIGQVVNGYKILELVGSGGFGAVYKAHHIALDRDVAIKVLHPDKLQKPDIARRFTFEAQLVARLSHPFIVTLYDYWYDADNRAFLGMKWFGGGSLRERLQGGALSFQTISKLLDSISKALIYAHSQNVIHRDVKPDNILFDEQNNAYLGDFGIAKDLGGLSITSSGAVVGTYAYAAPEQLLGDPVSALTDQYSLAITLYECVAGTYPFPNSVLQHLQNPLPPLYLYRSPLPAQLDDVVRRATSKDPSDRYPDIQQFQIAFEDALRARPVIIVSSPPLQSTPLPPLPTEQDMADTPILFISHSHKDDPVVNLIREQLLLANIHPWVDHIDIASGDIWDDEIEQRLNTCQDALFIHSAHSAVSRECRGEWRKIQGDGKHLHIALVSNVPPQDFHRNLRLIQYVDLRPGQDFEIGMARLIEAIKTKRIQPVQTPEINSTLSQDESPTALQISGGGEATLVRSADEMPIRLGTLIGRDNLSGQLLDHLQQHKHVLIQGFGGIGKTALAAHVARDFHEKQQGALLWVNPDRKHESASALLHTLIYAFGMTLALDEKQKRARLHALIREYHVNLVVLDDVWCDGKTLHQIIELLPPQLPVLVTSRNRYPLDEIIDLLELKTDDALKLLDYYARLADKADPFALELCKQVGNHPLALVIAGNSLRLDKLTPQEYLERVKNAPHRMSMPSDFADDGHESIKRLLDDSVTVLDDEARDCFLAFGALFAPAVTADLLSRVMDHDLEKVQQALDVLGQRGLVMKQRTHGDLAVYRVHDLAYSYARENARLSREAVIGGCVEYARRHVMSLDALDTERVHLLRAAESAYFLRDWTSLIVILYALTVDSRYLSARGQDDLLLEQLDRAIEAARKSGQPQAESLHYFLGKRGDTCYAQGKLEPALEFYQEALTLARDLKLMDREVILLGVISKVYSNQHRDTDAESALAQARKIALELQPEDYGEALSKVLEHQAYHDAEGRNDFKAAARTYHELVELCRHLNNIPRLLSALKNLGAAYTMMEDYPAAFVSLDEAQKIAIEKGEKFWLAEVLYVMGFAHSRQSNCTPAIKALEDALRLYEMLNETARANELKGVLAQTRDNCAQQNQDQSPTENSGK